MPQEITADTMSRPAPLRPDGGACQGEYQVERDALADEGDRLADEREALADKRERDADCREREAGDREQILDELARRLRASMSSLEEGALEQFDHSRAVLAAQMQRLDRQEAKAMRARARRMREEDAIAREAAADQWDLPAADSGDLAREVAALTQLARLTLGAFAQTAEEIARRHDEAAAASTGQGNEHRRKAERAREAVRRSAEIMREFTG